MKQLWIGLITSLLLSNAIADTAKVIRFGTAHNYPPFEFEDKNKKLQGFDIDIANALCKQLNAKCEFTQEEFDQLISDLNTGKFDAVIAALSETNQRKKLVAFSNTYYTPTAYFVARTDNHYTMGNITGKRIAVEQGTTFEHFIKNQYHDKVHLILHEKFSDALQDLQNKKADLVIGDSPAMSHWLDQKNRNKTYSVVVGPIINTEFFGPGFGIAVKNDNHDLLSGLNQALTEIKANGTYQKIKIKYFGK